MSNEHVQLSNQAEAKFISVYKQGATPNGILLSVSLFPAGVCQYILPGTD